MASLVLVKGARYFAGFSRPFFISDGMIRSHIEGLGGVNVQFHERGAEALPTNPLQDPNYNDDWDEWVSADYVGPSRTVEAKRHWKWAIRRTFPGSVNTLPPAAPSAPSNPGAIPGEFIAVDDAVALGRNKIMIPLLVAAVIAAGLAMSRKHKG